MTKTRIPQGSPATKTYHVKDKEDHMKQQHDEQQSTTPDSDETHSRDVRGVSAGSVGHTPGPWLAVRDPGHFHSLSTVVAGDRAEINKRHRMQVEVGGWAGPAEQEANTRLIAAAPKLLAALRSLLEDVEEDCGDPECGDCKPWRPARAAIADATGSAP